MDFWVTIDISEFSFWQFALRSPYVILILSISHSSSIFRIEDICPYHWINGWFTTLVNSLYGQLCPQVLLLLDCSKMSWNLHLNYIFISTELLVMADGMGMQRLFTHTLIQKCIGTLCGSQILNSVKYLIFQKLTVDNCHSEVHTPAWFCRYPIHSSFSRLKRYLPISLNQWMIYYIS